MSKDNVHPPVACTLTDEQETKRSNAVQRRLIAHYLGVDDRTDGYTFRFTGTDDTVLAVARFVANERRCCSFASYAIEIAPPYEETRLTITGPGGMREVFAELVDRLETNPV